MISFEGLFRYFDKIPDGAKRYAGFDFAIRPDQRFAEAWIAVHQGTIYVDLGIELFALSVEQQVRQVEMTWADHRQKPEKICAVKAADTIAICEQLVGLGMDVMLVCPKQTFYERLTRLVPFFTTGRILFDEGTTVQLVQQLRTFGVESRHDCIDALLAAVEGSGVLEQVIFPIDAINGQLPAVRPQTVRSISFTDDPAATMRDGKPWRDPVTGKTYSEILDGTLTPEWARKQMAEIAKDLALPEPIPMTPPTAFTHTGLPKWKPTALPDPRETVRWKLDDGTRYVSFAGALFIKRPDPFPGMRLWPPCQNNEHEWSLYLDGSWFESTWDVGQDVAAPLVLVARTGERVVLHSDGVRKWIGNETDGSGVIVDEAGILVRQADRVIYFEPPKRPLAERVAELKAEVDEGCFVPMTFDEATKLATANMAHQIRDEIQSDILAELVAGAEDDHFADPTDDPLLARIVPPHEWEHIETARTILEAAGGKIEIDLPDGGVYEKRPDGSVLLSVGAEVVFRGPGEWQAARGAFVCDLGDNRFHFITKDHIADNVRWCLIDAERGE